MSYYPTVTPQAPQAPALFEWANPQNTAIKLNSSLTNGLGVIQDKINRVIDPNSQEKPTNEVHHYHHYRSSWWSPNVFYFGGSGRSNSKESDRAITAIMCAIGAFATSYFLGQEYKKLQRAENGLKAVHDFEKLNISFHVGVQQPCDQISVQVQGTVTTAHNAFQNMKDAAQGGVLRRTILLVSFVAGFVGIMGAMPEIATIALITAIGTGCAMAFISAKNGDRDEDILTDLTAAKSAINLYQNQIWSYQQPQYGAS